MAEVFSLSNKLARRVCTDCGRHGMSTAGGDIHGQSRWLCVDCKHRYEADWKRTHHATIPPKVFRDMLFH